jgi:hypothetical protein
MTFEPRNSRLPIILLAFLCFYSCSSRRYSHLTIRVNQGVKHQKKSVKPKVSFKVTKELPATKVRGIKQLEYKPKIPNLTFFNRKNTNENKLGTSIVKIAQAKGPISNLIHEVKFLPIRTKKKNRENIASTSTGAGTIFLLVLLAFILIYFFTILVGALVGLEGTKLLLFGILVFVLACLWILFEFA